MKRQRTDDDRPALTARKLAELLGLHVTTVRAKLARGEFRGVKVGPRLWRIPRTELDRLLGVHEPKPALRGTTAA